MTLRERVEQLEPREQKLLAILLGVFGLMVVVFIPVLVSAMVSSRRDDNEQYREAIETIHRARDQILEHEAEQQALLKRYSRPAPPLASYLDKTASSAGIEIPESQDRAPVPHGKLYEERSTKLVLRKVGMKAFATFLEKIENSGYPVRVSSLNLRKRPTEPDSYDVRMTVSAYDRQEPKKSKPSAQSEEEEG